MSVDLLEELKKNSATLLSAGTQDLVRRYGAGSLSGTPVTVSGSNIPNPAGTNQPVRAATLPDTPTIMAPGISPVAIVILVLALAGAGVVIYKLVK